MRIAVNAQLLSFSPTYRSAGISRYLHNLLAELDRLDHLHQVFASVPPTSLPPQPSAWGRVRWVQSSWATQRPPIRIAWEQLMQPLELLRHRIDVLHSPAFVAPLLWAGPLVLTLFDLSFIKFPRFFPRSKQVYLWAMTRLSCARARYVLAISESTRRDVIDLLKVSPNRVVTTHCGVEREFHPLETAAVEQFREAKRLSKPFVLYVGTLEPRKNVETLVRAFGALVRRGAVPHELVLAGAPGWQYQQLFRLLKDGELSERVRSVGFVSPDELPLWYNAASLLAYPSFYEGFGLPVLEAMACGTPVVASNVSSLPEVVGDAGLLIAPSDELALADAMERVLADPALSSRLSVAGLEQARRFSWRTMAEQTLAVYLAASRSG